MSKNWKRTIKQWWKKNIVHIYGGAHSRKTGIIASPVGKL